MPWRFRVGLSETATATVVLVVATNTTAAATSPAKKEARVERVSPTGCVHGFDAPFSDWLNQQRARGTVAGVVCPRAGGPILALSSTRQLWRFVAKQRERSVLSQGHDGNGATVVKKPVSRSHCVLIGAAVSIRVIALREDSRDVGRLVCTHKHHVYERQHRPC
eukprot:CAMPEP_0171595816 /NCGR_PEP_ID=MMETSP0990-20121206/1563_1 /TAXON_ID=483369 /ORGANISM="non described non described, Strain CCMP2098" /LENGTH=163 /DNA_ID=CAMNT_0012156875 /DNA_START=349 /DNA_END=840 /DNA_ORIENTATION=-